MHENQGVDSDILISIIMHTYVAICAVHNTYTNIYMYICTHTCMYMCVICRHSYNKPASAVSRIFMLSLLIIELPIKLYIIIIRDCLWKLCSKFLLFFIPNFSQNLIMLNFVLYAGFSINIPYLQFKLPNKVSYFIYLMLVELLEKYSFHFH